MDFERMLQNFIFVVTFSVGIFVSYQVGKQSTIEKVLSIIEQEERVTNQTVILEDVKIDVSNLR